MGAIKERLRRIGSNLPITLRRPLPGELDGTLDPRDYGFDVIKHEPQSEAAMDVRVGDLYAQVKKRTDMTIPKLEPFLRTVDPEPAQRLVAKHEQLEYPYQCTFGGANLIIDEGVFAPTLTNASPLLLDAIDFRPDEKVLDVFSGSGAFGVAAALHGSDVVTIDTFDKAVSNTAKNAAFNDVSESVDARHGTMQNSLQPGEKFDLIIANPPLLPGSPEDPLNGAIFDRDLQATVDFIASVPAHLSDNGRAYLITSSAMLRFGYDIDELSEANSLDAEPVASKRYPHEEYTVYKLTHLL